MVPVFATAPALVVVGIFMFRSIRKIPLNNWADITAAFLTVVLMPFTYSISLGLSFGFLFWVLIKLVGGDVKSVSPVMWVVGGLSGANIVISLW